MSCALSCSTDSGVRNPWTTVTFVATGAAGAGGAASGRGIVSVATAVESRAVRFSIGLQLPAAAAPNRMNSPSLTALLLSGRFRLLQLLLPRVCDLVRGPGRGLLIHVKLLPVRSPAVSERLERRGIAIELRLGHERPDLRQAAVLVAAEDMAAPRGQIAHHGAQVFVRRRHLELEDRLEQRGTRVRAHVPERQDAGH